MDYLWVLHYFFVGSSLIHIWKKKKINNHQNQIQYNNGKQISAHTITLNTKRYNTFYFYFSHFTDLTPRGFDCLPLWDPNNLVRPFLSSHRPHQTKLTVPIKSWSSFSPLQQTHTNKTQTANSIPFQNLPHSQNREREREKWRTLKKQSWATSRRTRLPNGSFSTLLSVKSNTLPKVFFSLSLWIFWFLIFDFWFLEFGFALAFFFYDFSDLHFVLCVVLISWLFVHFGIFFFVLFGFFGRCESDTKRRRIVQRGSFGGVSVVQQITHDLPRNARPSRRCECLNL